MSQEQYHTAAMVIPILKRRATMVTLSTTPVRLIAAKPKSKIARACGAAMPYLMIAAYATQTPTTTAFPAQAMANAQKAIIAMIPYVYWMQAQASRAMNQAIARAGFAQRVSVAMARVAMPVSLALMPTQAWATALAAV